MPCGVRVRGSGPRAWSLGSRAQASGAESGFGCRVQGSAGAGRDLEGGGRGVDGAGELRHEPERAVARAPRAARRREKQRGCAEPGRATLRRVRGVRAAARREGQLLARAGSVRVGGGPGRRGRAQGGRHAMEEVWDFRDPRSECVWCPVSGVRCLVFGALVSGVWCLVLSEGRAGRSETWCAKESEFPAGATARTSTSSRQCAPMRASALRAPPAGGGGKRTPARGRAKKAAGAPAPRPPRPALASAGRLASTRGEHVRI
jgi:hypothetical protein